jgi:hypothetical protein
MVQAGLGLTASQAGSALRAMQAGAPSRGAGGLGLRPRRRAPRPGAQWLGLRPRNRARRAHAFKSHGRPVCERSEPLRP